MTLAELIAYVDKIRPNAYDKDVMTGWVNEIEHKVYEEVVSRALPDDITTFAEYMNPPEIPHGPYQYDMDAERELLVEDPHKDVYVTYVLAQMDYANMELDRFNADSAMHQAAWQDYAAEYRRKHRPRPIEAAVPHFFW